MEDNPSDNSDAGTRRYLIEIRGILQVEAEDGVSAEREIGDWIAAVGRGEAVALPAGVSVGWLRIHPESDDNIGWPPDPKRPLP